ncbi:MAG TPA: PfkB family carbohydrate kinase [Candidatus Acidoferrales bacterium]|nr:PfkB family carbohydrate kinase [Candidatus Acidoferrales bacterium]
MPTQTKTKISPARVARLTSRFRGRRIGVVGDWMLDRYVWGTASRLSPEAAVPVVEFTKQTECLGGAGNVAANLAALGARVAAFGVVGSDEAGNALRGAMRALKLPAEGMISDDERRTTLKTRIIARQQQVVRVDRESRFPLDATAEWKLARKILKAIPQLDALIVSDYDKGVVTGGLIDPILAECVRKHVPVFVKPKWSRLPTYRGATVIVCNRAEAGFLVTRSLEDDESVAEAGGALLQHFGCRAVVITRGERGMSVCEKDAPRAFNIAATRRERPIGQHGERNADRGREVYDVTGAGDTVLATLALAVAAGASVREGAILGNAAAGVVVTKLGTATLSTAELLTALRGSNDSPQRGRTA